MGVDQEVLVRMMMHQDGLSRQCLPLFQEGPLLEKGIQGGGFSRKSTWLQSDENRGEVIWYGVLVHFL